MLTDRELSFEFPRPVVDHVLADGAAPTCAEAERPSQLIRSAAISRRPQSRDGRVGQRALLLMSSTVARAPFWCKDASAER